MTRATLVLVPALAAVAACKGTPAPSPVSAKATVVQSSVSLGDPHIVSDSTNRLSILFYTIVRDDAPWVFLYRPTDYWGARETVAGWTPRSDGLLLLR
jgi:hypothetical protein